MGDDSSFHLHAIVKSTLRFPSLTNLIVVAAHSERTHNLPSRPKPRITLLRKYYHGQRESPLDCPRSLCRKPYLRKRKSNQTPLTPVGLTISKQESGA